MGRRQKRRKPRNVVGKTVQALGGVTKTAGAGEGASGVVGTLFAL